MPAITPTMSFSIEITPEYRNVTWRTAIQMFKSTEDNTQQL
jgi:hypothetical protein